MTEKILELIEKKDFKLLKQIKLSMKELTMKCRSKWSAIFWISTLNILQIHRPKLFLIKVWIKPCVCVWTWVHSVGRYQGLTPFQGSLASEPMHSPWLVPFCLSLKHQHKTRVLAEDTGCDLNAYPLSDLHSNLRQSLLVSFPHVHIYI